MPNFASPAALHFLPFQSVCDRNQPEQTECDSPGWWQEGAGGDTSTAVQMGRTRASLCPQDTRKFVTYR